MDHSKVLRLVECRALSTQPLTLVCRAVVNRNSVCSMANGVDVFDALLRAALPLAPEINVIDVVGDGKWYDDVFKPNPMDRLDMALNALGIEWKLEELG